MGVFGWLLRKSKQRHFDFPKKFERKRKFDATKEKDLKLECNCLRSEEWECLVGC